MRRSPEDPPIVILGTQVFHELVVDLDFPERRLALGAGPKRQIAATAVPVSLRSLEDRRVAVRASVEGADVSLLLDTGSDGEVALSEGVAQKLGLLDREHETARLAGVGGESEVRRVKLRVVELASQAFADVPCDVLPEESLDPARADVVGLLGSRFLSRFRVVLDYREGKGWFEAGR